jgi:hypothetical protein
VELQVVDEGRRRIGAAAEILHRRALARSFRAAQTGLGLALLTGDGRERDVAADARRLKVSAEQGHKCSQFRFADCLAKTFRERSDAPARCGGGIRPGAHGAFGVCLLNGTEIAKNEADGARNIRLGQTAVSAGSGPLQ